MRKISACLSFSLCAAMLLIAITNAAQNGRLIFLSTQLRPIEEAQKMRNLILRDFLRPVDYITELPQQLPVRVQAEQTEGTDGCFIGSDAARPVHPVRTGGGRFGAVHRGWLADDRRSIGSDASRPIDRIRASGGVALFGGSERADRKDNCECNVFRLSPSSDHMERQCVAQCVRLGLTEWGAQASVALSHRAA